MAAAYIVGRRRARHCLCPKKGARAERIRGARFHRSVAHAIRAKDPAVRVYFVSAFESYGEEIREKFVSDAELVRFVKKPTSYRVLAEMLTRDLERKHVRV
jgi:hypothetical protein